VLAAAVSVSQGDLPLTAPVPGGVAIVCVGRAPARLRRWCSDGQRVLVARVGDVWNAVVGLRSACDPARTSFPCSRARETVRAGPVQGRQARLATQHVTLANRRQVEPEPKTFGRIARDRNRCRRFDFTMRRSTPSPSTLPSRVASPRVRLSALFSTTSRGSPTAAWISRLRRNPDRRAAAGTAIELGDYFFNGSP